MISIRTTNALIGIDSTRAKLSIEQPRAVFEMKQKLPKVDIKTELGHIIIDQRQCFNEAGLKDNTAFAEYVVQESRQAVLEGISRVSYEGDMMAAIETKINAVAEIAASNSIRMYDFNVDFIPKSRPKIDFTDGGLDIQLERGYVDLRVIPQKPVINYEPGKVDIYMRQYPSISFRYVGNNVDTRV